MKKITLFAVHFFIVFTAFAQLNVGDIIITEIMANPEKVSDTNGEYFEVYNTTSNPIDLNGLIIEDHNSSHTINSETIVEANKFLVLGRNATTSENGGITVNYQYSSTISLLNSGTGKIGLKQGTTIIDEVAYNYSTFNFEKGKSLELAMSKFSHSDNDIAENWKASTSKYNDVDYGTPGSANSITLSIGITQIKKFQLSPNPITNGVFSISTSKNINKSIRIYTLVGKLVLHTETLNNQPIYVSNLQSGIYLIKVEESGKIATRKIIIK